jgi:hypothetical protein
MVLRWRDATICLGTFFLQGALILCNAIDLDCCISYTSISNLMFAQKSNIFGNIHITQKTTHNHQIEPKWSLDWTNYEQDTTNTKHYISNQNSHQISNHNNKQ